MLNHSFFILLGSSNGTFLFTFTELRAVRFFEGYLLPDGTLAVAAVAVSDTGVALGGVRPDILLLGVVALAHLK